MCQSWVNCFYWSKKVVVAGIVSNFHFLSKRSENYSRKKNVLQHRNGDADAQYLIAGYLLNIRDNYFCNTNFFVCEKPPARSL